jgi:alpha-tubulin suppressor-like RCC1 family protein
MISNKFIVDKASQIISGGGLTEQQISQMYSVDTLSERSVLSVANLAALPDVVSNLGSLVYVVAENKYYYSDGVTWNINYSSLDVNTYIAYSWARNDFGQLGTGNTTSRSSPVTVVGGITNWSRVSGGDRHSLGLTSTGILYAWGRNYSGQLGDGTTTSRSSPVTVVGGITNWTQLSAGKQHNLGLTSAGIAYAWGYNFPGSLGDGTTTSRSSPVTVVGGITNWSQLAAGSGFSLGLTSSGIAYAWGYNALAGQLGDGTKTNRSSPVTVIGGITNWTHLAAGQYSSHSLGITATGILYAWGANGQGQLGDGNTTARSSPVTVVGGITNWSQLAAGGSHSLGLTSTGIAYAWGYNGYGKLGDGTTTNRSSPVTVVGGITNWTQVSASSPHSLGLTSTGIAYAWGYNGKGQLGTGDTTARSSPATILGGITNWTQLSAGGNHSLGIGILGVPKGF